MMITQTPGTLSNLMDDLEGLWQRLDELFEHLAPGDWSRKHGKHWSFADVPYHLSYFDRDLIVSGIERGPNVPADEQRVMRTMAELNAWNTTCFAQRPADQTPAQSLVEMRASRECIRQAINGLSDTDLDRLVWFPLPGCGWLTTRMALEGCRGHTSSHVMQLRLHMKRNAPGPTPSQTHGTSAFYMSFLAAMLDREQAARLGPFTVVMEITGPGGGTWSLQVTDGSCTLSEGRAAKADLVMSQRYETFLKTMAEMQNPILAMLTRKIKVRGLTKMGKFAKLFPQPTLDRVLEPGTLKP